VRKEHCPSYQTKLPSQKLFMVSATSPTLLCYARVFPFVGTAQTSCQHDRVF